MNDADLMTRFESVRHLSRDHNRLVDRNGAFRDPRLPTVMCEAEKGKFLRFLAVLLRILARVAPELDAVRFLDGQFQSESFQTVL